MLAPDVVRDGHVDPDDPGRLGVGRLGLHPREGQFPRVVDALGELHHFLVLAGLPQRLHRGLVGDVVDAGPEHEGDRHRARGEQPEEVLCGQVGGESPAVGGPVCSGTAGRLHRRPGRHELQHVLAPGVHLHPQFHADDAVRVEMVGFGPHPGHGQLPRVVHGLGQDLQFLVLRPASHLQPDVVDRRADHKAERLEARLAEQGVLGDRQVGREHAVRFRAGGLRQPGIGRLGLPRGACVTWVLPEQGHCFSSLCGNRYPAAVPALYRDFALALVPPPAAWAAPPGGLAGAPFAAALSCCL